MDSEYDDVVCFSHVRGLSCEKCLQRFYELRNEFDLFLNNKQKPVLELSNDEWLLDLCFLVYTVEKLNQMNISLQGKDNLIIDSFIHINAFPKKLSLFESQLQNNYILHFLLLNELKNSKHIDYIKCTKEIRKLRFAFESRLTNLDKYKKIFEIYSSPFHTDVESVP